MFAKGQGVVREKRIPLYSFHPTTLSNSLSLGKVILVFLIIKIGNLGVQNRDTKLCLKRSEEVITEPPS